MDSACIRYTNLPASALFRDYLYSYDRVERFYRYNPFFADSYQQACDSLSAYPGERRRSLVESLAAQNGGNRSLEILAEPGTAVVMTGQQVGLFSGPAYTIYKALTAIRVAQQLTESGLRAVPAFWLATEDHDLDEAASTWTFDAAGHPQRLAVKVEAVNGQPAGRARGAYPFEELRKTLAGQPFAEEIAALTQEAYGDGVTLGEGFRRLLQRLFERYGLLFVDPLEPGLRKLAAPFAEQAFHQMPELVDALLHRSRELEAAGYHSQVHVEENFSLFFYLDGNRRSALKRQDGGWVAPKEQGPLDPVKLSPNALLRPVLQDYLLPTAAFVAGPAELAYLAQSQPLYDRLLERAPVFLPRQGFTLVDHRASKLMERYGLHLKDFLPGEQHLRETIASRLAPDFVRQESERARKDARQALERLEGVLRDFDPTIEQAVGASRRKIVYQLDKIQAKVGREMLRREDRLEEEARWLYDRIYPHRQFQERVYTILPFLAEHGTGLIERLAESVNPLCPDHQFVRV